VQEAGGAVTDFAGRPHTLERQDILASNGKLHKFAMSVARGELVGKLTISAPFRRLSTRMSRSVVEHRARYQGRRNLRGKSGKS
jgi:hypothetical protein